jgi:DNA replication protein DnaC
MSATAASEVAFLARALKAPRVRERAGVLAERAREGGWSYEEYLAAVLGEEVAARESHGGQARIKAARLPAVKTLDDFDFGFARSLKRESVLHLAQLDFLLEHKNVIFLGPPGTGKTHCETASTASCWEVVAGVAVSTAGMAQKTHWHGMRRSEQPRKRSLLGWPRRW